MSVSYTHLDVYKRQPYYTLEIEPDGTVRQKRTLFDRQHEDIEQATEFLQKWQKAVSYTHLDVYKRQTEQMAIFEAKVFLDRSDAEPFSMSTAQQTTQDSRDFVKAAQNDCLLYTSRCV